MNQREMNAGRLVLWLVPRATRRLPGLLAVIATTSAGVLIDLLTPWPMKILVDNVLQGHPLPSVLKGVLPSGLGREGLLAIAIAATIAIFLLGWSVGFARNYAGVTFGRQLVFDLGSDVFSHLQRLSLRFHRRSPVGDMMRRVTSDCGAASVIVKDAAIPAASAMLSLVGMFVVMWSLDAGLTLLTLAVIPPMFIALRIYSGPMLDRSYRQQQVEGQAYALVERTFSAIHVVQAFGAEKEADRRFRRSAREILEATLDSTHVQLKFKVLVGLATAAGTGCILWVGGKHALEGTLTIGGLLVFLAYLRSFYVPLQTLAYAPSTIQNAAGSARRVFEILTSEPEVAQSGNARDLEIRRGHIRFQNVTAGYEGDRPILAGITLDVKPGETLAIVGRTGAGKTTLVSLVPRVIDVWEGSVSIDGTDVRDFTLSSLRRQVAIVSQDVFLFPRSVAENIAYGRPEAARAEIESAARCAQADAFIRALPEGYDTVLGERGATLSGGERQRIAIARAFLTDAPIIILDEPTSALDAGTEAQLVEAIEGLARDRTVMVIAHRLTTVRNAGKVVVIEEGQMIESGAPDELIALSGTYARFEELQSEPAVS